jgi:hypothetical protein
VVGGGSRRGVNVLLGRLPVDGGVVLDGGLRRRGVAVLLGLHHIGRCRLCLTVGSQAEASRRGLIALKILNWVVSTAVQDRRFILRRLALRTRASHETLPGRGCIPLVCFVRLRPRQCGSVTYQKKQNGNKKNHTSQESIPTSVQKCRF